MFSFYGAKKRLASLYPQPIYETIIEPFAGSAAYSIKHYQKNVILYDVDNRIVEVWKYLINATTLDIMSLPMFGKGIKLDQFQQLSQQEKWFLGYMISASPADPKKTSTEKTNWNIRSQKKIADAVPNIKHWKVELLDFRKIPNQTATWFIDPPYQDEGKWYAHKLKDNDYKELKTCIEHWSGQIIACDNVTANWLDFKPLKEHKGQSNNKKIEGIYLRDC